MSHTVWLPLYESLIVVKQIVYSENKVNIKENSVYCHHIDIVMSESQSCRGNFCNKWLQLSNEFESLVF